MSSTKQVLVVDSPDGLLSGVMEELDDLGFRVVWVPTLAAALDFMTASPKISLIIASAAATQVGGQDFVAQAKALSPEVRIIWGARPNQSPNREPRDANRPDSLIPEPFHSDDLRSTISELLAEHFYPPAIAQAIKTAALEILGTVGNFTVEGGAFLVANQTALSDISAVIPFTGGISGHLMVGVTREHATAIFEAFLPGVRPIRIDRMEDLVGELCNQILGRINSFFAEHAVAVQHGTPIFIRAAGKTLRYPGRQPSFAVSLTHNGARVSLEYYLAEFDRNKLQAPVATRVISLGEIRYL
jgi:CheY-specific phosphatase CheX